VGDQIIIETEQTIIEIEDEVSLVQVEEVGVQIIEIAEQGIAGPPGSEIVRVAAVVLSGHRVVTVDEDGKIIYADSANLDHVGKVLGITTGAAAQNANITIKAFGELTEPSWNWDMDKSIYLGANGALTQTPPTVGFLLEVAFPLSPTSVFVSLKQPFVRS
jgi:hypothetical protein